MYAYPLESPLLKRMCLSKTRNTMCLKMSRKQKVKNMMLITS